MVLHLTITSKTHNMSLLISYIFQTMVFHAREQWLTSNSVSQSAKRTFPCAIGFFLPLFSSASPTPLDPQNYPMEMGSLLEQLGGINIAGRRTERRSLIGQVGIYSHSGRSAISNHWLVNDACTNEDVGWDPTLITLKVDPLKSMDFDLEYESTWSMEITSS